MSISNRISLVILMASLASTSLQSTGLAAQPSRGAPHIQVQEQGFGLMDGALFWLTAIGKVSCALGQCAKQWIIGNPPRTTELHQWAEMGYGHKVDFLLKNGADVNQKDRVGAAALHFAAKKGHREVVEILLQRGARVNQVDNDDQTPLHWAAERGHPEVAQILLQHGAEVNRTDRTGSAALHLAAQNGHMDTVHALLERGADMNQVDRLGRTPLHRANEYGQANIAHVLIRHAANRNPVPDAQIGRATIRYPRIATNEEHFAVQASLDTRLDDLINMGHFDRDAHVVAHIYEANGQKHVHAVDFRDKNQLQAGHDDTRRLWQQPNGPGPVGCPACREPHGFFSSTYAERGQALDASLSRRSRSVGTSKRRVDKNRTRRLSVARPF